MISHRGTYWRTLTLHIATWYTMYNTLQHHKPAIASLNFPFLSTFCRLKTGYLVERSANLSRLPLNNLRHDSESDSGMFPVIATIKCTNCIAYCYIHFSHLLPEVRAWPNPRDWRLCLFGRNKRVTWNIRTSLVSRKYQINRRMRIILPVSCLDFWTWESIREASLATSGCDECDAFEYPAAKVLCNVLV